MTLGLLIDATTARHMAVWTVEEGPLGEEEVAREPGQEFLRWKTTMESYDTLARSRAGGDYSAVYGRTPAELTADPPLSEKAEGVGLVAEEFDAYARESGFTDSSQITMRDMVEVLNRARQREEEQRV